MTLTAPPRATIGLSILAMLLGVDGAGAQSVDYGALEQLFGAPVTMSVTGKPQRVEDAPANIEIITQDDIRRAGATSIPDVLRFVTGVDVRENGLANAEVGLRGYNQSSNPHLMVLVDGRQVYMVDYGRIIWAAIPVQLDEIRQIEVIKGPNSALYGFNAVSGVINIITYDPLRDRIQSATIRGGTQDYLSGSAVGTGRMGDTAGLRVSLGGFRARDFTASNLAFGDRLARQRPFSGTFNADGRWQVTPTVEVFTDASLGDTRLADQAPPGVFQTETMVASSLRLGVNADTPIGLLSLSAYRSDARVGIADISFGLSAVGFGEYQTSYVLQASDLVKLNAEHTLRFGLEYRRNADDSGSLALGTISHSIYAANLMWDWQITHDVALTNALRIDHLQLHYAGSLLPVGGLSSGQYDRTTLTEPSFNSGAVWRVSDGDTFRVTVARGVQLPTLLEYGLQVPAGFYGPLAYVGRPDLRPTIIWSAELDYDRALPALGANLRTALFAQRIDDIIGSPFGAPPRFSPAGVPVFYSSNIGYSTAVGAEISIRGHNAAGLRWNASYALATTTDHTSANASPIASSIVEYAHSAPRHVVIGGVGYTRDRLELDLQGRWQSSFEDFRLSSDRSALLPMTVDNYVTVSARAGYQLTGNLLAAITALQLNQSRLLQTAGPPVERRIIASLTVRL